MESIEPTTEKKRRRSDQDRLESWKAIANYLNRSVRTARRWETQEQLPVHRHQYAKGNSVFAFCSELDDWRNNHHQPQQIDRITITEQGKATLFPMRASYVVIAVIAALMSGLISKSVWQPDVVSQLPANKEDAWVLIAELVNYQTPKEFGDNMMAALDREFSGSEGYIALPAARVHATLELMRKDPQTALTPIIAREMAQRDGWVKALLIPRIERFGESQVFSIEATDPSNDLLIAYASEEVKSLDSAASVFERLGRDIQTKLINSSGNLSPAPLARVTTASMAALRYYSQANQLLIAGQAKTAKLILDHAIEEDEHFASARVLQAWALRMNGADRDAYMPIMKSAMQYDLPISDQERYLIEGSNSHFLGDLAHADANYQALLDVQPDHVFGARARLELCIELKTAPACVQQKTDLAKLRPRDFEINLQAAWTLAQHPASTTLATRFADTSLEILQKDYNQFGSNSVARALLFPVISAWTKGNLQDAYQKGRHLQDDLPLLPLETRQLVIEQLVELSLVLGQIKEAENLLMLLPDPAFRYELQARILFAMDDDIALKKHLASGKYSQRQMIALFMSISGLNDEAIALYDNLRVKTGSTAQHSVILAGAALENKDLDTAKLRLQSVVEKFTPEDHAYYFVAADMLSAIHKSEGNLIEAVSVLESTMSRKNEAIFNSAGLFWLKCQKNLAHLYRDVGRDSEAVLVEKDLRNLFSFADEKFSLISG